MTEPTATTPELSAVVARALTELGDRYCSLDAVVDRVLQEYEQADPMTAAKAAEWSEAERRLAWGDR